MVRETGFGALLRGANFGDPGGVWKNVSLEDGDPGRTNSFLLGRLVYTLSERYNLGTGIGNPRDGILSSSTTWYDSDGLERGQFNGALVSVR